MFQFLFRYPSPVFTKGHFVFLSAWPAWLLGVLILAAVGGLAFLIRQGLGGAAPNLRNWRVWAIWGSQSALVTLLLVLLWRPAMVVSELSSQQNIIAVVVDDSHSMSNSDSNGKSREQAALDALNGGLLSGLQTRFQTRIYKLGSTLSRADQPQSIAANDNATHLADGLKQLVADTADLPVGAVLLLSDGSENNSGLGGSSIGPDTLQALRNRRLPVHTIGFGKEQSDHDVEIEDVSVPASAAVNARVAATVSLTQRGYTGQKAMLNVRDGSKTIAQREIELGAEDHIQVEPLFISAGAAGAKDLSFSVDPLPSEQSALNNSVSRPILVTDAKRRVLYVEGEPRWEYKFIRRAEDDDPTIQVVSMLRTRENKIYRPGIGDPNELSNGFPTRAEDLFGLLRHHHRFGGG